MRALYPRSRLVVEKACANALCGEYAIVQELPAFETFGRLFLQDDEEVLCRECGEEMTDV